MENQHKKLKIISVSSEDVKFLYELLIERDPKANISHKKMPTFQEHTKFVDSRPYKKWYVIKLENRKIGSVYLTKQNEIGIFIKKEYQGNHFGNQILKLLIDKNPEKRFLANVNPKNTKSINFFKKNNFKLIQHTYELELD